MSVQYSAKLLNQHKTIKRVRSDNYVSLLAYVVSMIESCYPAGIGLIRDNNQHHIVNRITRTAIVD